MQIVEIVLLIVIIWLLLTKKQVKINTAHKSDRQIILDSCALIDGRIIELANSGFIPDKLIVPEFVLKELQLLADGNDSFKRERARFGMDVVKELQTGHSSNVVIDDSSFDQIPHTDDKLIALAKKINAPIYTTDYNLNKVADIQGIRILNVNELAQQLRPSIIPGQQRKLKIVQKGTNQNQGVGYLEDGTMVVVEGAAHSIGKTVDIEIARNLQTVAGKMLFGHLIKPALERNRTVRNR
ncbi:MAG TPA: TRAM domain-containing protein [Candidatus Saccharimonadales bacterium]|nr:TRAM domain-containing protein [Candidatus Saccharimonadales bacterium]